MQSILLIGAGRSASTLINYLLSQSSIQQWKLTVADLSEELALQKTGNHANARSLAFDIHNPEQLKAEVAKADLVISMLPAALHLPVAKECLVQKKNMVTASYVSKPMKELDADAKKAGVIFLNEIGLDPGIDHLSAMKVIDEVHEQGGKIITFKSYCGGLIAPESNDNPWGYKFTWNPRAVVMAGQGGDAAGIAAQYMQNGKVKYIPYTRLFANPEKVKVDGLGSFDAYANRDSLAYMDIYGLKDVQNMYRGTLRNSGFCKAWNAIIQLGMTDDGFKIEDTTKLSYADFTDAFLPFYKKKAGLKKRAATFLREKEMSPVMQKLDWLGIFKNQKIGLENVSPAEILLNLLMKKWELKSKDKDMIVMKHEFEYTLPAQPKKLKGITSTLMVIGENQINTAMSKTVGLPLGIATKLILNGGIKQKGIQVPTVKEIYFPILKELNIFGIHFKEKQIK